MTGSGAPKEVYAESRARKMAAERVCGLKALAVPSGRGARHVGHALHSAAPAALRPRRLHNAARCAGDRKPTKGHGPYQRRGTSWPVGLIASAGAVPALRGPSSYLARAEWRLTTFDASFTRCRVLISSSHPT